MNISSPAQEAELKEEEKNVPYSQEEIEYLSYLQNRLESARNLKNSNHDEFDGMTYTQYHQSNLMGANSYIAPKKNPGDTRFTTGTTRQALLAYVSKMNSLNLTAEIKAFDRDNTQHVKVGHAIEDIVFKCNELDHDEEKRILREYEMFMQGTVFVQKNWVERFTVEKTGFDPKKWDGKIDSATWTERLKKVFCGVSSDIKSGLGVFLGKITEFDMEMQPYFFTVDYKHYDDAKSIYGEWERWKYVTKKARYWSQALPQTLYSNNWRLENTNENIVEEIIYRDKWANEFMVILNGVAMLKPGFPMPWEHGNYDVVKQVFEFISSDFAYGGSLIKRLKVSQQLEDEFWRLGILKTQKSYQPARGNTSGQIVGPRVFMPGNITPGLTRDMVATLDENNEGVTMSEVKFMEMIKQNMKDNSVPDLNQDLGQDTTATAIMQLKRQADILMGNALFSCTMLEKKLQTLTMYLALENWFEPYDEEANEVKMEIKQLFRSTSRTIPVEGEGMGRRMTRITSELPQPNEIYEEEEKMSKEEKQPVRITYLNPEELKKAKLTLYVSVTPREKETSEMNRIMFGNMMQQAINSFQQDLNLGYFEEKFAEAWNLNADKAFVKQGAQSLQLPNQETSPASAGGLDVKTIMPKLNELQNNAQIPTA